MMWNTGIIPILFFHSVVVTIQGFGFRGFHYEGLKESVVKDERTLEEKWIEQPLDQFDISNNKTWLMRFYENDEFFNKTGPIFIMLGGEWTISTNFLQTGTMYENAKVHGALMYYTEHRYYGKSRPVSDTSVKNLLFLTVDQALADLAFFIEKKKDELNIVNAPVVVFGGSYSGNMAAWARIKYPHLILGSLASSAPVRAKADFFEYYDVVQNSLNTYDKKCVADTKEAFAVIEGLLIGTTTNPIKFKEDFNLCDVPDVSKSTELGWIMNSIAEIYAGIVQYNSADFDGQTSIGKLCNSIVTASENTSSPYERLAKVFRAQSQHECRNLTYAKFVNTYRNTSWESEAGGSMRQWLYQTCTEYGYYQTSSSAKSIFGKLFPIDFFIQICKDLYGEYFGANILKKSVKKTNRIYGADLPDVTNVIFTNGNVDPWHSLSVLKDLNEATPAIFIKGSSHCADLQSEKFTDTEGLKNARYKIASIISMWLNSTQPTH